MTTDGADGCPCKIGNAVDTYRLGDLPAELERHHDEGASLRELADEVNVRIVEAAIDATAADVAGDAASVYAALEDGPAERRVAVEEQFTGVGIDVDDLRSDFVSYGTVRRHFKNCVGRDTGREGVDSVEEARHVLDHARDRCERVIEQTLNRLRRIGIVAAGPLSVRTSVRITCTNCERSYSVTDFLNRRQCHCPGEESDEASTGR